MNLFCVMANSSKPISPYAVTGGQPSHAFCLLLRLLTLRCSEKQMKLLLDHVDSPYIRGIGFLYLRYAGEPSSIWGWIEPYLYDDEPITVATKVAKNRVQQCQKYKSETVGDFVRRIFSSERDFYGTMLPRLPIQVERDIQVKLLFAEKIQERAQKHLSDRRAMECFKTLGSRVMALYGDDENPTTWYEGVIDRVILRDEGSSQQLAIPKFVVTFTEYGNTETVTLGEMEIIGAPLDSVNDKKSAREERREYLRSNEKKEDTERNCERSSVRGNGRGYVRGDSKNNERRGYSNGKYYDRDDRTRAIGAISKEYSSGNGRRRGENKHRRGYHGTDYDDSRDYKSRRNDPRNYSTSQFPSSYGLYEEVRRREQANVISNGKQTVARRPIDENMRVKDHRDTNCVVDRKKWMSYHTTPPVNEPAADIGGEKRSTDDIAVKQEKRRKLLAKYG